MGCVPKQQGPLLSTVFKSCIAGQRNTAPTACGPLLLSRVCQVSKAHLCRGRPASSVDPGVVRYLVSPPLCLRVSERWPCSLTALALWRYYRPSVFVPCIVRGHYESAEE